jgi:hypothetical protein
MRHGCAQKTPENFHTPDAVSAGTGKTLAHGLRTMAASIKKVPGEK